MDRITYNLAGEHHNVECLDLRIVTLKRVSDGALQVQQMWVLSGTKDKNGIFYPLQAAPWTGSAMLYFDLNGNDIPDDGSDAAFEVIIPGGDAKPFALHETFDKPYIINVWYTQPAGHSRQFWASHFRVPTCIENPYWIGGGIDVCGVSNKRFSILYKEAYWKEIETGEQTWSYGGGNLCQIAGQTWPCAHQGGGSMQYYLGGLEVLARGTAAVWWTHVWSGSDAPWYTFSLFHEQ